MNHSLRSYKIVLLVWIILILTLLGGTQGINKDQFRHPNAIIVLTDEQGYGDMSCTGNPFFQSPNMDKLYKESVRLTNFCTAPTCAPSRAQLLTGRYTARSGIWHTLAGWSNMDKSEVTLAEVFKENEYHTNLFGKWHLGVREKYQPANQSFEYYFDLPYSTDDNSVLVPGNKNPGVSLLPLIRNKKIVEIGLAANILTQRDMQETKNFIKNIGKEPFFLYVAYSIPHVPVDVFVKFKGKSKVG